MMQRGINRLISLRRLISSPTLGQRFPSIPKSSSLDLPDHASHPKFPSFPAVIGSRSFTKRSGRGGDEQGDSWDRRWRDFEDKKGGDDENAAGWDSISSWSTGLTEEDFEGKAVGRRVGPHAPPPPPSSSSTEDAGQAADTDDLVAEIEKENRRSREYVDSWDERMKETRVLLKQIREPGARGSYLKDSEKSEMYRLHKENPEVYTVERLAKDYRIMRQRVHAILWLKQEEEEEEKRLGHPLDDSIELLLDTCPEFFNSHDKEFHVASLPYKPEFKVMPEGWDGTVRDPDEVHYEISAKEDEMLYREFVQRMEFNKKKEAGEVKCHKYSRRRPSEGWNITIEKLGPRAKCGGSGGWKFVSLPDGSSRPLNEMEKMYVKRETVRRRRRILP
ncbi:hypothetical protein EJ110_NYTH24358 [Nymphaea thermarum]|nr:hypothetical protein EJ110_NYTH24358 [Nymphaea thermarum]